MIHALSLILWFLTQNMHENAPCLPAGIEFIRQGQVDSFNIRNPGCDQVTGNLTVNGNITRLDSLYKIKSVGGIVSITNTITLKTLTGLGNIQSIGLGLIVINNKQLNVLTGLNGLTSLGGDLLLNLNDSLRDISAVNQLVFNTNQRITITNCPKLSICNTASICQFLTAGGNLVAQNNAAGCSSKYQVVKACNPGALCPPGDIILLSQAAIQDFALNFPNCKQLSGSLTLSSIDASITALTALPKLTSIAKSLIIYSNSQLTSLSGMDSLKTIGSDCSLSFNRRIKNLNGLGGLLWINQSLYINNNDSLTSLQSLGPIRPDSLNNLNISNCARLTVCSHPSICTYLSSDYGIYAVGFNGQGCNSSLQVTKICNPGATCPVGNLNLRTQSEVNEFYSLYPNCIDFPGYVQIFGETIKNLDSLYKLRSIANGLFISVNDSLVSIQGLSGLRSIGHITGGVAFGQVFITDNKRLPSLKGLDSVRLMAREININRNDSLKDITGLSQVQFSTQYNALYIYDNPKLPVCNLSSICTYLAAGGNVGVGGNAKGCSNNLELFKACNPGLLCPTGDVNLYSQQEIDAFGENFPNCTVIEGSLNIDYSNGPVYSLEPLKHIRRIEQNLNIVHTRVQDLRGLDSLEFVGVNLNIAQNSQLKNLNGLSALKFIREGLYIETNDSLLTLDGLENLNADTLGDLYIYGSNQLTACSEAFVCTYITRGGRVFIENNAPGCNTVLQVQKGCYAGLVCPPGNITFYKQQDLVEFAAAFPNCSHVQGNLAVGPSDEDDHIVSLAALSKIKSVSGDVDIEVNPRLKSLVGLDSLQAISGHLQIGINDSLINLTGLGGLKSLSGELLIQSNIRMTSLTGLGKSKIDSITALVFEDNTALSMCGIEPVCNYLFPTNIQLLFQNNAAGCNNSAQIRTSCGIVVCGDNEIFLGSQADVDQFPKNYPGCNRLLQGLFINGANITNLDSLRQIKHVGSYVIITANPQLTRITGLSNLETVGGDLDISNNPLLQSAQGLSSLKSINGYLGIYTNYSLSSLGNINQLDFNTITELILQENQKLSICNIPPVCGFINDPDHADVISVSGNNTGCETPNQIKSACGLSTCPTGNIILTTQQEVNQFRSLLSDCTILPGDLTITGANITYLDSLSALSGIHGVLRIENTGLNGLYGLDDILASSITHLVIKNNPSLAACEVRSICDYISIPSKTYEISGNASSCSSVNAITAACGKTCYREGLIFTTQAQVDAFTNNSATCEFIPGTVYIDGSGIVRLDSLYKIKNIGGALTIANTSITSLHGLESLRSVGSLLDIRNNSQMTNLDALQNLTSSGATLRVSSNAKLTSINGLRRLKRISFNLIIQSNALLTNLSGLDSIETITNDLRILSNASLTSTAAIRRLSRINNNLQIESNALLAEVDGFESVGYVGNDMRILNNASLNTLRSFTNLDSIRGFLRIETNNGMDSVTGLSALRFIGNGLRVRNNAALKNLNALSGLTHIGQQLQIFNNGAMISLKGLDQIDPNVLFDLTIQNSILLQLCNIKSICNYLRISPARTANISGNAATCNSKDQILAACQGFFPVSFISFKATAVQKKSILRWQTASERHLDYYQVEWSKDGLVFQPLGIEHAANSIQIKSYEYIHQSPSSGLNYYRLKLMEQDGSFSYSDMVSIRHAESINVFPNPTQNKVFIQGMDAPVKVILRDMMGRILLETKVSNGEAIDLTNHSSGIYILSVESGNQPSVFRVVRE